ncbi:farnesol dehydrogenase-like [Cylas formicarius]|uniref:farnesol dehydrogenase-like n=1 Tax=Cylas formicarius TaxID=197179 RepID=UPI0029585633|nr:farnesol dehydrogenase-like [Cylas formicarius]
MVLSMTRWSGKVAVVTGASAGCGSAIAEHLVKYGLRVAGLARRVERVEELAEKLKTQKGKLVAVKCDMTNEENILEAFKFIREELGTVHILINNAGLGLDSTLFDGETETWKTMLDTNVLGLCIATREVVREMIAENINGHIIHINSIVGHKVVNFPKSSVYTATKFAVTGLAEALRFEINELNLKMKITSVSPGAVATEFFSVKTGGAMPSNSELNFFPILKAEDVANAVIYALSTPPHVQVSEITIQAVGEKV